MVILLLPAEIIEKDKVINIHFDGWSEKFDYVTEVTSVDLHPVGWFEQCYKNHPEFQSQLQAPKGFDLLLSVDMIFIVLVNGI